MLSRRLLQITLASSAAIPIGTGLVGLVVGTTLLQHIHGTGTPSPNIDSEFSFYSVFWLGYGLAMLVSVQRVEQKTRLVRWLSALMFIGGLGRLGSIVRAG